MTNEDDDLSGANVVVRVELKNWQDKSMASAAKRETPTDLAKRTMFDSAIITLLRTLRKGDTLGGSATFFVIYRSSPPSV